MANKRRTARDASQNPYGVGVVTDHGRVMAKVGNWTGRPEYGIDVEQAKRYGLVSDECDKDGNIVSENVVKFRKFYYDASSETKERELTDEQCRTLADGGAVRLKYVTSSGVEREHDFMLSPRVNPRNGVLYMGPVKAEDIAKEATAAKALMDSMDMQRGIQPQVVQNAPVKEQFEPQVLEQVVSMRSNEPDAISAALKKSQAFMDTPQPQQPSVDRQTGNTGFET